MTRRMKGTRVVNIRNYQGATYIGRKKGSTQHFGNPFSHLSLEHTVKVASRDASIKAFREWLNGDPKWAHVEPKRRTWILNNYRDLDGKALGCFCAPNSCHGDVYVEMLTKNIMPSE